MQREEFMLNVDWTEVVALFNVDSRYACSVVVAPVIRKIVPATMQGINGAHR
ncbi:hypothetical protein [Acidovorax carolinensis]|jgi:hypothetical protein|uniref:hypothetical protein n=1 Tax=Acidovorax TaxID=12916 RepID=UPI00142E22FD|nr:hypothetical protein [Acidovorax carolinensis]